VLEKVWSYANEKGMLSEGGAVIAGLSGGADSVCLVHLLKMMAERSGAKLLAVHVNHCIRGSEADADEAFAADFCRSEGVPFKAVRADVPAIAAERGIGLEEAGREERRRIFFEEAQKAGAAAVALAHHMDDRAETLLWNLARGTGAAGLGSIRPIAEAERGGKRLKFIRPLLCVTREEIEEYLRAEGLGYVTDATNADTAYSRNLIRSKVLPVLREMNPKVSAHMSAAADEAEAVEAYLERETERIFAESAKAEAGADGGKEVLIFADGFQRADPIFKERLVRLALLEAAGRLKDIGRVHSKAAAELFCKEEGKSADLPYGLAAVRTREGVWIGKKAARKKTEAPSAATLKIPGETRFGGYVFKAEIVSGSGTFDFENEYTKFFAYDRIKALLELRTRRPGDFMTINPDGRTKSLSDVFTDRKLPKEERGKAVLMCSGDEVLWAVGIRGGESARVGPDTERVLKLTAESGD